MRSFHLVPARGVPAPILFDSPHSGREYPPDFGASASLAELRRAEDAYVDQLLAGAADHGVTTLLATAPRCYIDLNRVETDVDPGTLEDADGDWMPTEKSARGLGLIRELVVPGIRVYSRKLASAEVRARIERFHRPYHDALDRTVRELRATHGHVVHVDWHSMKSVGNAMTPDGDGTPRPDFVVGDLNGASASPAVTATVVSLLRGAGFTVSVNEPYAGGWIIRRTGDPAAGVDSLQIEINRGLYLDEVRVEKTAGFDRLRAALDEFTGRLVEAIRDRGDAGSG